MNDIYSKNVLLNMFLQIKFGVSKLAHTQIIHNSQLISPANLGQTVPLIIPHPPSTP